LRVTSPAIDVKDVWDALVATYGTAGTYGLLLETQLDAPVSGAKADLTVLETAVALNLDSKVSLAKADLTTLESRLSAARATALDELLAGNLPTDLTNLGTAIGAIPTTMVGTNNAALASALVTHATALGTHDTGIAADIAALITSYLNHGTHGLPQIDTELGTLATAVGAIPTTMVGTNNAALASAWTAALATILGNFSAANIGYLANINNANLATIPAISAERIGYLDNIDASLKDLFYEHFQTSVDDLPNVTTSGDTGYANLIDNDVGVGMNLATSTREAIINFGGPCYIKKLRHYGDAGNDQSCTAKLLAYVDGAWVDALRGIVTVGATWSSWLDLDTPRTAIEWKFISDTFTGPENFGELELSGIRIGV